MISAIVLAPDLAVGEDIVRLNEVVVRSLAWLVSAVVAGVVRDVVLAAPQGLGLGEVADQAGCTLIEGATEAERLSEAMSAIRGPLLLVVRTGYRPQSGLIEEVDDLVRHQSQPRVRILAAPTSFVERLFPDLAATIGLLAPAELLRGQTRGGFRELVGAAKGATRLRHRASAIA